MRKMDYHAPVRLDACLEMLSRWPDASVLAGGTDLVPRMKERLLAPGPIVSLRSVGELASWDTAEGLALGATARLAEIMDRSLPAALEGLRESASLIGSRQIRNAATVGGNLCNAAPSADTAPALLSLDARVDLIGEKAERTLPLAEFFRGPGQTVLRAGELLKVIRIPTPLPLSGSCYVRHTPRGRMDLAVAGVGVSVTLERDTIAQARVGLGAVAPMPIRAAQAEAKLVGRVPGDGWLEDAAKAAATECVPIDDQRASAAFRRHLVAVLVRRAVSIAYTRAIGSQGRES